MDSVKEKQVEVGFDSVSHAQVGVNLQYPRIGSLSLWERVRVRGF